MKTCRDEILRTLAELERGSGRSTFTVPELIGQMKLNDTKYMDSTIRTHVTSRMCCNAPDNHGTVYNDLERVANGEYRLLARSGPHCDRDPKEQDSYDSRLAANIAVELLATCRKARERVQKDAEAFLEGARFLENVGQVLVGAQRNGLGEYKNSITNLIVESTDYDVVFVTRLYNTVREARNDAAHVGASARHASSKLVKLLVILEEALMADLKCAKDIMVPDPMIAEPWHLVLQVRSKMLENSFSYIPLRDSGRSGKWLLLADHDIAKYLNSCERKARKSLTVHDWLEDPQLKLTEARCVPGDTKIGALFEGLCHLPILVFEGEGTEKLIGIITPFDLL